MPTDCRLHCNTLHSIATRDCKDLSCIIGNEPFKGKSEVHNSSFHPIFLCNLENREDLRSCLDFGIGCGIAETKETVEKVRCFRDIDDRDIIRIGRGLRLGK